MKQLSLVAAGCLALATGPACSSGSDDPDDTSDSGGTGGSGSGGTSSGGSGGTSTTSTTGEAGAPGEAEVLFSFDDGLEGFVAGDDIADTDDQVNLSAESTVSHDSEFGAEAPGSLKIEIPFAGYTEGAEVQYVFGEDNPQDFSDSVISAKIYLEEGGFTPNPTSPGGIIFFMKSGTEYAWGQAGWRNVDGSDMGDAGEWFAVTFDPDDYDIASSIDGFDASEVLAIGFKFDTGSGLDTEADELPTPAVFWVDDIVKTPK
jgi:hypothetical protein